MELVVLANRDERPSRVEAVREQEEGEEVDEGVWELLVLLERDPDLLPADGEVVLALGELWARARILEDEPPDAGQYPVPVRPAKRSVGARALKGIDRTVRARSCPPEGYSPWEAEERD